MGFFFHRRAHCAPAQFQQTECETVQPETCSPQDPHQFAEVRNQRFAPNQSNGIPRNCTELPPPAPAAPLPGLIITDNVHRAGSGPTDRTTREVPPPPLPDPELAGNSKRDLYQYGDGKPQQRVIREIPPPPLPDPELAGNTKRDLYQYGDGKPQQRVMRNETDLPQQPSDLSLLPGRINRDLRAHPEKIQQNGQAGTEVREEYAPIELNDHPGPGSRRRRSLREQLNLPERHSPDPGRTPDVDRLPPHTTPMPENNQSFAPPEYRIKPTTPRPREPVYEVDDHHRTPHQNRLEARLERIKEEISRLAHFSSHEKEVAFTPSSAEQRTMDLINNERRRHRLPDLVHDPRLQMIANRHTDYQVKYGMTHNENTPGWQNVSQRMQQVGLEGWRENAGTGAFTPESLVQMWMNSPGHRAAILGTGNIGAVSIRNGKATFNLTTDPELQRNA